MARDCFVDTVLQADNDSQNKRVGRPLSNVQVTVYAAGTTTVQTIYTARTGATQKPNPFNTADGAVEFWAETGDYDIKFQDNNIPARVGTKTIGWEAISASTGGIPETLLPTTISNSRLPVLDISKIPQIPNTKLDPIQPAALAAGIADGFFKPGDIKAHANYTIPSGWVPCNGAALSRTTYAALYNVLGAGLSPWGQGDGSTTFNVPDLRGRMPMGVGTHTDIDNIGTTDGRAVDQRIAAHTHLVFGHTHTYSHVHGAQGFTGYEDFASAPRAQSIIQLMGVAGSFDHVHNVSTLTTSQTSTTTGSTASATNTEPGSFAIVQYFIKT